MLQTKVLGITALAGMVAVSVMYWLYQNALDDIQEKVKQAEQQKAQIDALLASQQALANQIAEFQKEALFYAQKAAKNEAELNAATRTISQYRSKKNVVARKPELVRRLANKAAKRREKQLECATGSVPACQALEKR